MKQVVIGLLGPVLDNGQGPERWSSWRPTVSLCQHEEFLIDRLELLYQGKFSNLASLLIEDIRSVSPETEVRRQTVEMRDPWDFEQVYGALHEFARQYPFDTEQEEYYIHITTGTHVAQICLFLLTESRHFPGKLIQTAPPDRKEARGPGRFAIIDLDLSKYDRIAARYQKEQNDAHSFLKGGIDTRNLRFNRLIEQIEHVAIHAREPMLLMGPTGAGKSQLARRIYELKKRRHQVSGPFVEVNCATLRGEGAMSALFGHVKGAFTGAVRDRPGLLRAAHQGILFLDEVGELGLDEQTMLLRALEEKRFLPVGADSEVSSDFQLIAGTNRDLAVETGRGRFREDLLARINLWTFKLPSLRERQEDIAPNLDYELDLATQRLGRQITISKEARAEFLVFAISPAALWSANFRDFSAAITRMATLAPGGRITREVLLDEIARLKQAWKRTGSTPESGADLGQFLGPKQLAQMDPFDQVQLASVVGICRESESLSEAGRKLFACSREKKRQPNDADRLRKYLARFGLQWDVLQDKRSQA